MRDAYDDIRAKGADIAVIGSGEVRYATAFKEQFDVEFEVLTDPTLEAFEKAELKRSLTATFSPRGLGFALRAVRDGHRQGRTRGDALQLGGAFVVTPSGDVTFAHVSQYTGDHASTEDILRALS